MQQVALALSVAIVVVVVVIVYYNKHKTIDKNYKIIKIIIIA